MPIYGIIVSVIFLYFDWDVPGYLENTTFLLTYYYFYFNVFSIVIKIKSSVLDSCINSRAVRVIIDFNRIWIN